MTSSPVLLDRQRGNTLTGIIIGLIIGLGIAVVVALVISKGDSPFTDKAGHGKMNETTAGQAADPNKPLYSNKDAARAANKQIADKQAAEASKAQQAAQASQAPQAQADPLGAAIEAMKTEAKPAVPAAPVTVAAAPAAAASDADNVIYYLQAGAFREVTDAEATRAKLALLGFEASITDRTTDAGVLHRVRIGPFPQVEAMNKARAKLLDSGIDVAIVRNQK